MKKSNRFIMTYLFVGLLASLLALWGCPKKTDVASAPETQAEKVASAGTPTASSTTAGTQQEAKSEGTNEKAGISTSGLQSVYFDFDKSFIRKDERAAMKANAEWLKANPKAKIRIEGNCDDRGTIEYNQALGQRRDTSAKRYLTDMGVSPKRITLISYGKEKPVCTADNDACWQKNRRDDFVVISD